MKAPAVFIFLLISAVTFAQTGKVLKESGLNKLNAFVGTWQLGKYNKRCRAGVGYFQHLLVGK